MMVLLRLVPLASPSEGFSGDPLSTEASLNKSMRGRVQGFKVILFVTYSIIQGIISSRAVRYGQKIYITIFLFFSISILITILTQTDMLYSYKCILCEFETYFQI